MPQDDYILKNGNPLTGAQYGSQLGYPQAQPQFQVQPNQMGAPVNGADMLSSFALVPTTPITPPMSPYSPRPQLAQSGELNDLLNQSPETQFLGKPTPPPSPTPAPVNKPNQYAV